MRREKRVALKPKGNFRKHFRNDWMLYAMLLPVLLWYVIFCYLPMGDVYKRQDRGEGIAAEDLPNIFQTFYTSQIKPVDSRKGIGLGLTISESIVRQHGGRMEAHNRTDGPGAEFIFTLPLKTDTAEEKAVNDGKEQVNGTVS